MQHSTGQSRPDSWMPRNACSSMAEKSPSSSWSSWSWLPWSRAVVVVMSHCRGRVAVVVAVVVVLVVAVVLIIVLVVVSVVESWRGRRGSRGRGRCGRGPVVVGVVWFLSLSCGRGRGRRRPRRHRRRCPWPAVVIVVVARGLHRRGAVASPPEPQRWLAAWPLLCWAIQVETETDRTRLVWHAHAAL